MAKLPVVCAVMLTANRPEMARQAVECFRRQTYDPARRELLIYDTGDASWFFDNSDAENECIVPAIADAGKTIGALRNAANSCTIADRIIIHWDDDDYSDHNRIAEQVALLQSSGAVAVGYNEALFWREMPGEAWVFRDGNTSHPIGSSLCYRRAAWERHPFADTSHGEDYRFALALERGAVCVSSRSGDFSLPCGVHPWVRLVCRIHGGNTSTAYRPEQMAAHPEAWRRAPEYDEYCRLAFGGSL